MAAMELDHLDKIAAEAFDGYIVRKDLVRTFARHYPVPTYVCEFLLGRYCASIDADEITEGLAIVERQLRERAVRSGKEDLFKSRAREKESVKLIDLITARLDARTDSYLSTLPSLQLRDVVCFDEVSGVSFDQQDGVSIMKGYMESGEFSRGQESIRADGGLVLVGNFAVDVEHQQRIGHLFGPLAPEMRHDTAFMDRIQAYLPGWDVPKISEAIKTEHCGLVSDFLSACWARLRSHHRAAVLQGRVTFGDALSGRDQSAVHKTTRGLRKRIHPSPDALVPNQDREWAVRLGLECRRRVKEQQKRIGAAAFRNTQFSYTLGPDGVEIFVVTPERQSDAQIGRDPLPPGQVWAISPGGEEEAPGLYRVEVTEGPGSGVRILNRPAPGPFAESVKYAEQNLYPRSRAFVGDRNPRAHEFALQLRAFDTPKSGQSLGVAALLALCSALIGKSLAGGLVVVWGAESRRLD
jgi:ATP-dependent Lon protease